MTEDVKNADANAPKKLSIQRRTKTTVSSTTAGGKAKAVQVEVRKKRTVPTDAARQAAEAEKLKAQQEAEKKAAEKKTDVKISLSVQFDGKSYTTDDLVKIAKDVWKYDLKQKAADFKSVDLYVKPEEGMAYYVVNGKEAGGFYI